MAVFDRNFHFKRLKMVFNHFFHDKTLCDNNCQFVFPINAVRFADTLAKGRVWYHSNRLDELIRLHPLDRQKMHGVESNRASKMKSLKNQRWTAHSWTPMSFLYVYI